MPSMRRISKKATQIFYKIMGVPANMRKKKESKEKAYVQRKLTYLETTRMR
jgi:hypothetical protein